MFIDKFGDIYWVVIENVLGVNNEEINVKFIYSWIKWV